jgi:hypothetical protein
MDSILDILETVAERQRERVRDQELNGINELKPSGKQTEQAFNIADLRDLYLERAGIAQFDGGQDRATAERMAWSVVAARWYRHAGERVPAHLCAGCGEPIGDGSDLLLLPHGERAHADPDYRCTTRYGQRWRRQAAVALAGIGIPTPASVSAEISIPTVLAPAVTAHLRK